MGTRLYVHQVISTARASDGDVEEAAAYLAIPARLVRAAITYYADFADEVDEDADLAARVERDERARWEREQRALVKLALDHHYSPAIASGLRTRGHDTIAISERGWEAEDDASLLELCRQELRALLTNNVGDFALMARAWATEGRQHSGLVFTSDVGMPRGRNAVGRYLEALDRLMGARPADDDLADTIHWL